MSRILVTGATGFVGRRFLAAAREHDLVAALREPDGQISQGITRVITGAIDGTTDWRPALAGVDAVVHLAARAHILRETSQDPEALYRKVNVDGTIRLARQAADSGVRRFVYISSIKVNGEFTGSRPFSEEDPASPTDPYSRSKRDAEEMLRGLGISSRLEIVIVRPPLVYGPGVGGNLFTLLKWIARGVPLPLGLANNRRSMIGVDNLADLVLRCVLHPAAAGQTYLASDDRPVSTPELVRALAMGIGVRARLLPVPAPLLLWCARMAGQEPAVRRLLDSLEVDRSKAQRELGWVPRVPVLEGLHAMGSWFRQFRHATAR